MHFLSGDLVLVEWVVAWRCAKIPLPKDINFVGLCGQDPHSDIKFARVDEQRRLYVFLYYERSGPGRCWVFGLSFRLNGRWSELQTSFYIVSSSLGIAGVLIVI